MDKVFFLRLMFIEVFCVLRVFLGVLYILVRNFYINIWWKVRSLFLFFRWDWDVYVI